MRPGALLTVLYDHVSVWKKPDIANSDSAGLVQKGEIILMVAESDTSDTHIFVVASTGRLGWINRDWLVAVPR